MIPAPNDRFLEPDGGQYGLRSGVVVLMLIYALAYLDRQLVSILAEPIKNDLHLSDKQLGLLVGLSFAIFYTGFGLPIARLAERMNRSVLIALCVTLWSVFTALCGVAGSFLALLLVRIGVGFGEAGCLPASQALIADYVSPRRQASAMALLIAGSPVGVLLGMALGGIIAQHFGWRAAFFVAALPGLPLALILLWSVKDPLRATALGRPPAVSFGSATGELLQNRAYMCMVLGAGLGAFASCAQAGFLASFLLRVHKVALADFGSSLGPSGFVGLALGVIWGIGGLIGTLGGGRIADKLGGGSVNQMKVCVLSSLALVPFLLMALLSNGLVPALAFLIPCSIFNSGWAGPFYAAVVSTLSPNIRATAAGLALLLVNLIGLGAGPLVVGTMSDRFATVYGSAEGLRWALVATTPVSILSAILFALAGLFAARAYVKSIKEILDEAA